MKRKLRILLLAATMGLLIVGATGCGSSSGNKDQGNNTENSSPGGATSTAAVAKGIMKGFSLSESRATCAAKKIQTKLSDKELKSVAEANPAAASSDELARIAKELNAAVAACP